MAYRKKGAKSASRRSYRRRYTRRRRYRRKYPKRSGRRFPKGTEVKSKQFNNQGTIVPATDMGSGNLQFYPGYCFSIGGDPSTSNNIAIKQGTAQGERVGAKIEPIKLRISGTFQLVGVAANVNNPPNFWQVRMLVYQVKGANAQYAPSSADYHSMSVGTGNVNATLLPRIFSEYYFTSQDIFTEQQWRQNNGIAKMPLRRGIGGLCRVLYKKSFWINTQKNPIKQFRFVTKVPRRLVYPETPATNQNESTTSNCNNAIYVMFVAQPGTYAVNDFPKLYWNFHADLFYTDK